MAEEKYVPRLKTKYQNEVKQALHDKFQYENVMMIDQARFPHSHVRQGTHCPDGLP